MANARDTIYWEACLEKGERMEHKDPWKKTRQRIALFFIFIGRRVLKKAREWSTRIPGRKPDRGLLCSSYSL